MFFRKLNFKLCRCMEKTSLNKTLSLIKLRRVSTMNQMLCTLLPQKFVILSRYAMDNCKSTMFMSPLGIIKLILVISHKNNCIFIPIWGEEANLVLVLLLIVQNSLILRMVLSKYMVLLNTCFLIIMIKNMKYHKSLRMEILCIFALMVWRQKQILLTSLLCLMNQIVSRMFPLYSVLEINMLMHILFQLNILCQEYFWRIGKFICVFYLLSPTFLAPVA